MELRVEGIAHGGVAVARLDGRVVFVADAIPGETVLARVTDRRHDSFWRAETVRVLDESPDRRAHVWTAASVERDPEERAGGAEFGHIDLARQRALKAQVLREGLQRFAKIDRAVEVEPAPGDGETNGLGWRTRVTLHADETGRVGPYAARSHTVVPVSDLPLASVAIADAARLEDHHPGVARLELVAAPDGVRTIEVKRVRSRPKRPPRSGRTITHRVRGREYTLSELGFWQVHRQAPEVLTAAVIESVQSDLIDESAQHYDLYGGVGLFAGAFVDQFGGELRVSSIEYDPEATEFASRNLADLPGATAQTASVDRYVLSVDPSAWRGSTVILDPPRKGAGREVVQAIARGRAAQVVYVACDPIALARDIATFRAAGYELAALRAFDLFPHTHHVEAVARLVPAG